MAHFLREWQEAEWDKGDPDTPIPPSRCSLRGCSQGTHHLPCPLFFHSAASFMRNHRATFNSDPASLESATNEQKRWLCLGAEMAARMFQETADKSPDPWTAPDARQGLTAAPPSVPPPPACPAPELQPRPPPPPPSDKADTLEEPDPNAEMQTSQKTLTQPTQTQAAAKTLLGSSPPSNCPEANLQPATMATPSLGENSGQPATRRWQPQEIPPLQQWQTRLRRNSSDPAFCPEPDSESEGGRSRSFPHNRKLAPWSGDSRPSLPAPAVDPFDAMSSDPSPNQKAHRNDQEALSEEHSSPPPPLEPDGPAPLFQPSTASPGPQSQEPYPTAGPDRFASHIPSIKQLETFWDTDTNTQWGYHLVIVLFARDPTGTPCVATAEYHSQYTWDLLTGDYMPKMDAIRAREIAPQMATVPAWLRAAMRHVAQKLHLRPSKVVWGKEALLCIAWRSRRYPYLYRTYRKSKDIIVVPALYLDACASPDFVAPTQEYLLGQFAMFCLPNNPRMYSTRVRWTPYFGNSCIPLNRQSWHLASVAVAHLLVHPPTPDSLPTRMLPMVWPPTDDPLPISATDVHQAMQALWQGGLQGTQAHDAYILDARVGGPWTATPLLWTSEQWRGIPPRQPAPTVQAFPSLSALPSPPVQEASQGPPPASSEETPAEGAASPVQTTCPRSPHPNPLLQEVLQDSPLATPLEAGTLPHLGLESGQPLSASLPEPGAAPQVEATPGQLLPAAPLETGTPPPSEFDPGRPSSTAHPGDETAPAEAPSGEESQERDPPLLAQGTPQEAPPIHQLGNTGPSQWGLPEATEPPPAIRTQNGPVEPEHETPQGTPEHTGPPSRAEDPGQRQTALPDQPGGREADTTADPSALGSLD